MGSTMGGALGPVMTADVRALTAEAVAAIADARAATVDNATGLEGVAKAGGAC